MEWLLYVVALTDDPAMAHGAFLNIQALMRAKVHPCIPASHPYHPPA